MYAIVYGVFFAAFVFFIVYILYLAVLFMFLGAVYLLLVVPHEYRERKAIRKLRSELYPEEKRGFRTYISTFRWI